MGPHAWDLPWILAHHPAVNITDSIPENIGYQLTLSSLRLPACLRKEIHRKSLDSLASIYIRPETECMHVSTQLRASLYYALLLEFGCTCTTKHACTYIYMLFWWPKTVVYLDTCTASFNCKFKLSIRTQTWKPTCHACHTPRSLNSEN